jgi:hypothetical protein
LQKRDLTGTLEVQGKQGVDLIRGQGRRTNGVRIREQNGPAVPPLCGLVILAMLAACSSGPPQRRAEAPIVTAAQLREYAPPGPPEDPWGPYIREASQRYGFPDPWIRAVMRQESGGQQYRNGQLTTSAAGAIGLMQVMPETYAELRGRYGLGPDPYYPRDNILAGTAYLRELYDRFGSPGFLAAYNAGPQRESDHLTGGRPLPAQTVAYVAAIGPHVGASQTAAPAPNYAAADSGTSDALNRQALAAAIGNIQADRPVVAAAAPANSAAPRYASFAAAPAVAVATLPSGGEWGIQVGAFTNQALAQAATDSVRARAHGQLDGTRVAMPIVTRSDGVVLYRARLVGLSADAASSACNMLAHDQFSCIVVAEDHA